MQLLWPKTLYARTTATLAAATVMFLLLTLITVAYLVVVPVAKRSAEDLSALMVVSAQTWAELPPQTRPDFERELALNHGLILTKAEPPLTGDVTRLLIYLRFLQESLTRRSGQTVSVHPTTSADGADWFWVDIPVNERMVRFGFELARFGPQPPLAALIVFTLSMMLVLLTALLLVRRLTHPLARFSRAVDEVGRGGTPSPLPETGPVELSRLARTFNHMVLQVRELLADRTTMLSGIAHDLRTPLARLNLTLEMLKDQANEQLLAEAEQDLEAMDHLIDQYLQLGQVLTGDRPETIDVREIIDRCVIDARRMGTDIDWTPGAPCLLTLQPMALTRILSNLLQNAVYYGRGNEVRVECEHTEDVCVIKVLDRGVGIPPAEREAVFRPFYRLEPSRSSATGGSGLGLAIAQQLARFHGWHLGLKARPGGGTEASVEIPVKE
ncbi:MAG: HAMP domain-containing histidine kinase [Gammaproteobacteria bacterium]|nr:HAMP domain-containing histidine kinase [Gammaproteobacteria bacterium]MCW8972384.1 HAMP domain-containing histidine kinase [Gammaproteobacteria bacterium]MCW8992634.1 HAMP domain-containing histidine kinase [Gammaproteobacteria bacterium]